MAQTLTRDDDQYTVIEAKRVTGTGPRFDGRMTFKLKRTSDGQLFTWLGSRHSTKVPHNARLHPTRSYD